MVGLTETQDLELIFGTSTATRKYKNLLLKPNVAVVLGNDVEKAITVQYEGVAQELPGEELDRCRDLHVKKIPRSEKFAFRPQQRFFKVRPRWIRYTNEGSSPRIEFEIEF